MTSVRAAGVDVRVDARPRRPVLHHSGWPLIPWLPGRKPRAWDQLAYLVQVMLCRVVRLPGRAGADQVVAALVRWELLAWARVPVMVAGVGGP